MLGCRTAWQPRSDSQRRSLFASFQTRCVGAANRLIPAAYVLVSRDNFDGALGTVRQQRRQEALRMLGCQTAWQPKSDSQRRPSLAHSQMRYSGEANRLIPAVYALVGRSRLGGGSCTTIQQRRQEALRMLGYLTAWQPKSGIQRRSLLAYFQTRYSGEASRLIPAAYALVGRGRLGGGSCTTIQQRRQRALRLLGCRAVRQPSMRSASCLRCWRTVPSAPSILSRPTNAYTAGMSRLASPE